MRALLTGEKAKLGSCVHTRHVAQLPLLHGISLVIEQNDQVPRARSQPHNLHTPAALGQTTNCPAEEIDVFTPSVCYKGRITRT